MSSVSAKLRTTYSSPRSRNATRPNFNSGAGLAEMNWFAMDQIFCFAPSISPLIELVVSSTKHTSMRGLISATGGADSLAAAAIARASIAQRVSGRRIGVLGWELSGLRSVVDFVVGVAEGDGDI